MNVIDESLSLSLSLTNYEWNDKFMAYEDEEGEEQ